jgi:hypothetical protein
VSKRIVIGVGIANYPLRAAGNSWAFLQWALAFRDAGWDVWLVEELSSSRCVDENRQPAIPERSANLRYGSRFLDEFGFLEQSSLFIDGKSRNERTLIQFASSADLFLNISGHFMNKDILKLPRSRIYLDLDPVFTQIWTEVYNSNMNIEGHDHFVTVGTLLPTDACTAPTLGKKWIPTVPPVSTKYWMPDNPVSPAAVWTTVTHWHGYRPAEYKGEWYGNKSEEFEKVIDVPGLTKESLEIATDLEGDYEVYQRFKTAGWRLCDAAPLNDPWQRYRDYIARSKGEFCVAKNGYVKARSGWFSDRSVCYLALGRPVVLQDTGWSTVLPEGKGLLKFTNTVHAAAALDTVASDYTAHSKAARELAVNYFAGQKVVERLLAALDEKITRALNRR